MKFSRTLFHPKMPINSLDGVYWSFDEIVATPVFVAYVAPNCGFCCYKVPYVCSTFNTCTDEAILICEPQALKMHVFGHATWCHLVPVVFETANNHQLKKKMHQLCQWIIQRTVHNVDFCIQMVWSEVMWRDEGHGFQGNPRRLRKERATKLNRKDGSTVSFPSILLSIFILFFGGRRVLGWEWSLLQSLGSSTKLTSLSFDGVVWSFKELTAIDIHWVMRIITIRYKNSSERGHVH